MNPEITTSAERTATVKAEPRLTLTELQGLLRDATALERAQRPIYIQPSTVPAVTVLPSDAVYAAPQHPGINIRYPSAAEGAYAVPRAPLRHPAPAAFAWGVRLAYAGVALLVAGAAGATVTDGNGIAVGACVAGIGAVIGGTARATVEENRWEARS